MRRAVYERTGGSDREALRKALYERGGWRTAGSIVCVLKGELRPTREEREEIREEVMTAPRKLSELCEKPSQRECPEVCRAGLKASRSA